MDYLTRKCGLEKKELFIHPIVFVKNEIEIISTNIIVSKEFTFKSVVEYIKANQLEILCSYKKWKSEHGFMNLIEDVKSINKQASKDSELGFLTKKKIDRIGKLLSNTKQIYEELNNNLIIIKGKAGTGKTTELLSLMLKKVSEGQNSLFLTYNKLLIYDIARTVRGYVNKRINNNEKIGEHPVITLHSFFYKLSKTIGVLHVLSDTRKEEIKSKLGERTDLIINFFNEQRIKLLANDYRTNKTILGKSDNLDIGTKEVGIDLINYIKQNSFKKWTSREEFKLKFIEYKTKIIDNLPNDDIFLIDYYGVLENTLLAISDPDKFYKKYNVGNRFELLDVVLNLSGKKGNEDEIEAKQISAKTYRHTINRRTGGLRRKRTLFVDESQDCDRRERDILMHIFGKENMVVSSGGKEQLIRHVELCNWEVFNSRKIITKNYTTRSKSFRIKENVLHFCNYIADYYKVDLNLEPIKTEDKGQLIIDIRSNENVEKLFESFIQNGEINECTPYESLLILIDARSKEIIKKKDGNGSLNDEPIVGAINEYDNIEERLTYRKNEWKHVKSLSSVCSIWDGTVDDNRKKSVPYPTETRLIHYESCRGLEAWTVACFNLDVFFDQKREEPDAEKFLVDLFSTEEERRNKFAATWILMALTRAIDTQYIKLNDVNHEFSKVILDYAKNNENVKILKEASR